jgi:hypothetical protein
MISAMNVIDTYTYKNITVHSTGIEPKYTQVLYDTTVEGANRGMSGHPHFSNGRDTPSFFTYRLGWGNQLLFHNLTKPLHTHCTKVV